MPMEIPKRRKVNWNLPKWQRESKAKLKVFRTFTCTECLKEFTGLYSPKRTICESKRCRAHRQDHKYRVKRGIE